MIVRIMEILTGRKVHETDGGNKGSVWQAPAIVSLVERLLYLNWLALVIVASSGRYLLRCHCYSICVSFTSHPSR